MGHQGVFALDLGAHDSFQFAVLLDQQLNAFVEAAAFGVEVFLEAGGEAVGDLPVVLVKGVVEVFDDDFAFVADGFGVDAGSGFAAGR